MNVERQVAEGTRFSALRTVATLLRVIAVLEGVLGLWVLGQEVSGKAASLLVFAVGVSALAFRVLLTIAVAEAIGVFLAIEQNTRRPADVARPKADTSSVGKGPPEARETPSADERFVTCKTCGKKTEADSRFCQKCGAPT